MGTELAVVTADRQAYIEQMKAEIVGLNWDDIKHQYAENATDKEFAIFLDTCQANVLDPRKKECYFVKYGQSKGQVITGYQTYIQRADRTGLLDGWDVKIKGEGKEKVAEITIHRKDFSKPFVWTVDMVEFHKGQSTWNSMENFMLKKVAIAQGFRLAFPNEVGGLPYTSEEVSTYADEDTAKAALATGKDITSDVEVKPTASKPVPKKQAVAKPAPKPEPKEEEDNIPMGDDAKGTEEKEPEAEEAEAEVVKPESDAVLLSDTTKSTMLKAFEKFKIGRPLMESALGVEYDKWNEDHRVWLVDKYHECNEGQLDAKKFAALEY